MPASRCPGRAAWTGKRRKRQVEGTVGMHEQSDPLGVLCIDRGQFGSDCVYIDRSVERSGGGLDSCQMAMDVGDTELRVPRHRLDQIDRLTGDVEHPGLDLGLCPFVGRSGIPDDATPDPIGCRLLVTIDPDRSDGDVERRHLVGGDHAGRTGVHPAWSRLERFDDLGGSELRGAGDRGGRECGGEHLGERSGRASSHRRREVQHGGIALDGMHCRNLKRSQLGDAVRSRFASCRGSWCSRPDPFHLTPIPSPMLRRPRWCRPGAGSLSWEASAVRTLVDWRRARRVPSRRVVRGGGTVRERPSRSQIGRGP